MAKKKTLPDPPAPAQPAAPEPIATAQWVEPAQPPPEFTHELPRLLHRNGEHLRVDTQGDCEAAFRQGWTLRPEA